MLHTTFLRPVRTAAVMAVLAGSLLLASACGSGVEPPSTQTPITQTPGTHAPITQAPITQAPDTQAGVTTPTAASRPADAAPVATTVPWPADGASATSSLQATADAGGQPWLLDPLDVAQAYAVAVLGWRTATVSSTGPDQVRISAGGAAVLVTVGQPARAGRGGIWVVTGERPA